MSIIDELEKLQKLKKQGILTETELENEKKKILSKDTKKEKTYNNEPKNINEDEKKINKENKVQNININKKQNNKKFCSKCGNEIQEGEKFCGKCGNKIKSSSKKLNTYQIIMLSIIAIIILTGILLAIKKAFDKDETSNLNDTTTTLNNSNTSSQVSANTEETENKVLDIIDKENKEFKINVNDLADELIKVKKEEEEYNRVAFKSEYEIKVIETVDNYGNKIKGYYLSDKLGESYRYYVPPFIFHTNINDNIFQIAVLHRYSADYGTNELETSDDSYTWLYKALNNLGYNELSITIEKLRQEISDSINNKTDISSEFNINGVHIRVSEAGTNKYGNIQGLYFGYALK